LLDSFSAVEIYVLSGKNLNGHVVYGIDGTLHDDGIEECIHAGIALLVCMLGNEE